jgi:hypothetical protein
VLALQIAIVGLAPVIGRKSAQICFGRNYKLIQSVAGAAGAAEPFVDVLGGAAVFRKRKSLPGPDDRVGPGTLQFVSRYAGWK